MECSDVPGGEVWREQFSGRQMITTGKSSENFRNLCQSLVPNQLETMAEEEKSKPSSAAEEELDEW